MSGEDGDVITGLGYVRPGYDRLVEVITGYIWLSQFKTN